MSALLDSLLHGHDGAAAQAIRAAGLPGPRSEAWKYTPLRAFERRAFSAAAPVALDRACIADIPTPRLVFVNGYVDPALSDLSGLPAGIRIDAARIDGDPVTLPADATPWQPAGDDVFANVNALLARQGARIDVQGEIDAPMHLVVLQRHDAVDRACHLHQRVTLRPGASMTLVEHVIADGEHANLATTRADIEVGEGAALTHLRVQTDSLQASGFLHSDVRVAAKARYARLDLELGSALSRHELRVRLEGESAHVHAGGVLLADARRHLDTRLDIVHGARATRSELPWRGLAGDRARAVFHGGIRIDAGADGSEANLQNRNLLLSDSAEIDTQPVLVIHADEVQAAHGATVGQLDPVALFYLRSRGIPEAEARRILTAAFCRDLLSMVEDAAVRDLLERHLGAALARMQAA